MNTQLLAATRKKEGEARAEKKAFVGLFQQGYVPLPWARAMSLGPGFIHGARVGVETQDWVSLGTEFHLIQDGGGFGGAGGAGCQATLPCVCQRTGS